jgi:hypothetical protein
MKNSIKLSALFLLLSAGIFASNTASAKDVITLSALRHDRGVAVNITKADAFKSLLKIYYNQDNILFKDFLPNKPEATKGYVLTNLDNGDYTFEVTSNKETIKKTLHVYEEGDKKAFFFVN